MNMFPHGIGPAQSRCGDLGLRFFLQVTDLFFRSRFAFFVIELKSRKVIHVGVRLPIILQ